MTTEQVPSKEKVVHPWDLIADKDIQQLVFSYEMILTEMRTHARPARRGSAIREWVEKLDRARDEFVSAISDRRTPEPPAEHEWPLITRIKADIVANCFENREWSAESEDHCATLDLLSEALEVIKERAAQPPAAGQSAHDFPPPWHGKRVYIVPVDLQNGGEASTEAVFRACGITFWVDDTSPPTKGDSHA